MGVRSRSVRVPLRPPLLAVGRPPGEGGLRLAEGQSAAELEARPGQDADQGTAGPQGPAHRRDEADPRAADLPPRRAPGHPRAAQGAPVRGSRPRRTPQARATDPARRRAQRPGRRVHVPAGLPAVSPAGLAPSAPRLRRGPRPGLELVRARRGEPPDGEAAERADGAPARRLRPRLSGRRARRPAPVGGPRRSRVQCSGRTQARSVHVSC
mmetsp:Transcript_116303/g.307355  ORF Transcript_116303/g.307355 Transcript_116303/m.307355 type:complete len:211 (-) Transcript_116303:53-685(-)